MQQSPSWEAKRFPASQEISRILWNPKVRYRDNKSTPPVTILRQINPVHPPIPLPEAPSLYCRVWVFQVVSFPQFFHQNPVCTSPPPTRASRTAHLILLDLITRIIFGEE